MARDDAGDPLDATTVDGKRARAAGKRNDPMLALTIIAHPDLRRVGEHAFVSGEVSVSRKEPAFSRFGSAAAKPLADPQLSRTPQVLDVSQLEGVPAGVVCEVSDRVAVLLHRRRDRDAVQDDLGIVGDNDTIVRMRQKLFRLAAHDVPVLIRGESGSGKELVARAIHRLGGRKDAAYVSVNLGAVPNSTAAAALFGHVRGAFTGAVEAGAGYFGAADGGTLFLDEVGHAPEGVQTALLRALEVGEVQRIGEAKPRRVDVRLLAATDADLESEIDQGRFKLPLLMRLAGFEVRIPPLRDRRDDIAVLLTRFVREELGRFERLALLDDEERPWLPAWLLSAAARHEWPGNVRQLRNLARQLVIEHADDPEIPRDGVAGWLVEETSEVATKARARRPKDITDDELREAMARHDYRADSACVDLGISRSALYGLLRKRNVVRRATDLGVDELETALAQASRDVANAARELGVSERALRLRMTALGVDDA